ncbi:family 10 glycosylhydrolase [Sutcliffiella horikoshii]|uniref:family 10 glycosylhydrolase n=1 Tax=Sutcliffiella horikoshii TaxID=79883 RepID=UPI00384F65FB
MKKSIKKAKLFIISALVLALILTGYPIQQQTSAALAQDLVKAANGETHVIFDYNTLRGADQLIIYTPEFGTSTKNNRWGVEVVVEDGMITEVRDGTVVDLSNAPIPENGFVVSAHGTARAWVMANLKEGETVEILKDVIADPVRTSTYSINKLDPQAPYEFPGGRGADELVVYTSAYGKERTGTNQYGAEFIVRNGIVVEMSGSNSLIPEDGFVVSGHGAAQKWILENTQVGAEVTFNPETMKITSRIDASAYIRAAELVMEKASAQIEAAETNFLDVPIEEAKASLKEAEESLKIAEKAFVDEDWQRTIDYSDLATQQANKAGFQTVESKVVDARGVWHRPTESNREDIIETLDKLADSNFNILFLETFFHGYTIYPSEIAEQNPNFVGWDPLEVFIEEGKKRGIEVHAWVHTFFVGHESLNPPGPILTEHPEWAAVDREGRIPSVKEVGYYYLNPALPAVRDHLSSIFNEMVTTHEVDGLHLDYIRYPVSLPIENGYSYDEYSRNEFKKVSGVDPLDITPADAELWEEWNVWRQNQISTFVERIHGEVKEVDESLELSTAVFPEVSDAIDQKFQNWVEWVSAGYMDFITPMIYAVDTNYVQRTTNEFMERFQQPVLSYIGLAPFVGFSDELLVDQVKAMNETDAAGQVQFALHSLREEHFEALKAGPQRKEAFLPHADPMHAAELVVKDTKRKIADIYIPRDGVDHPAVRALEQQFINLERAVGKGDISEINGKIAEVQDFIVDREKHIHPAVSNHLIKDLDQLKQLMDFAQFKQQ